MEELNIVDLIENNPITKLNGNNYQSKMVTKIKEGFSDFEQHMFVSSFYCFLNYNSKKDFVIDLDDVWKWLGFNQKVKAKSLLENHFKINVDYIKSLSHQGKQTTDIKGGQNKETFMLNVKTFKLFCIKARTKKADVNYIILFYKIILYYMDTFKDSLSFKEQLNKFIIDNNVIGTTAGVGIGLATKDVIQSLVSDIVFPAFYLLIFKLHIPYFNNNNKHIINYAIFLKQFITWLVIVIITFIFVQVSFKILLGVNIDKKDDKK